MEKFKVLWMDLIYALVIFHRPNKLHPPKKLQLIDFQEINWSDPSVNKVKPIILGQNSLGLIGVTK